MWNGYESAAFSFAERSGIVVFPKGPANGRLILKTEYLDAFPGFELAMLDKGYHLCFLSHQSRWAPEDELDRMAAFVAMVAEKYALNPKCILVGMSCGGLQAARFAQLYPQYAAVLYLDAPVLNILSMAGLGEGERKPDIWRELVATYGFSTSTVINFRQSPIDHMDLLLKNKIPVLLLYGNADNVVIYEENGKVLEQYYREHGGKIKVIARSMCGHHPHGLDDPTPIVEFVEGCLAQ